MKKGYIFLIDAVFALVILVIGFMIISSGQGTELTRTPLTLTADNIVELLSTVKINEVCTGCVCTIDKLSEHCYDDIIKNTDQTFLDYLGELYYTGNNTKAAEIFSNLTREFYRTDLFGTELVINNVQIYIDSGKSASNELISRKKLAFGYYEQTETGEVEFWGPYVLEVNVWEK